MDAQKRANRLVDENLYRVTTDKVAQVLLRVLEQGDNSDNQFDDSFYIKDILASLGRLDNLPRMHQIACEIYRQFKLDQISNSSPQFAVTIGAIKGYYNMRKQIFRFVNFKKDNIAPADSAEQNKKTGLHNSHHKNQALGLSHLNDRSHKLGDFEDPEADVMAAQIEQAEEVLDQMKADIDRLLLDPNTPLQLRIFIFDQKIKNLFFYANTPFVKALQKIIDAISQLLQQPTQTRVSFFFLRELVLFLESTRFIGRLSFLDLYLETNELPHRLMDSLWELVCLPHGYLSPEFLFWVKRLINRLYGQRLPHFLEKQGEPPLNNMEPDKIWKTTEEDLLKE